MGCIKNCWDQTDHTGVYSCPQCRETFTPRPVLCRNTMLAEVAGEFKRRRLNPPPAQSYAGPGDVLCDFCTGRKFKAVKSCLTCLASYCETHVKPHSEITPLKRHKLINAIGDLEQKLCAEHQKVLEVFCRTDQTCVCVLCSDKEHKSHDTVSAEAERSVKQNFQSLCAPPEAGDLPSITVNTDISFGAVRKAVSELKDHIEDFWKGELVKITTTARMASNLWSEDQFSCSVCLEILKDPVTIPCGHSYCMGCIKNCWDQTDHTGVYSCPQCRETFTPRPVLCRNTVLSELVGEFKKTGLNPPPAQSYAGPGDVSCDVCTGRKFKAVKSCLTCLASYCETHIKPHSEVTSLKSHKLINAIGDLEQKLCAEHQRVLEVFCRTDQTCICWLCTDKEHKSHDTVSEKERSGKQRAQLARAREALLSSESELGFK
ncbi:UNVERIFIED_CONTAM: hypothetical protein FKN15_012648 [Acipenser sinensis]